MGQLFSRKPKSVKGQNDDAAKVPNEHDNHTPSVYAKPCDQSAPQTGTKLRAIFDHKQTYDDDMSFKKNDIFEIIEVNLGEDWWKARNVKTNETGYIPSNYVVVDDNSIESQDWWFDFDRSNAIKQLMGPANKPGTFLVRPCSGDAAYALSVLCKSTKTQQFEVDHFQIREMDNGESVYIIVRVSFPTLPKLISFYQSSKGKGNGLPMVLTKPCPRQVLQIPFKKLEVSKKDLNLGQRLGEGNFGEVFVATYRGTVEVVVKSVKVEEGTDLTSAKQEFLREAKTMNKLRHPRLVQLLGVCFNPLYIIMEKMTKGSLKEYLSIDGGQTIMFNDLLDMTVQITEGMYYLESKNFVHRDLRAANILVDANNTVKVADFGLARLIDNMSIYTRKPDTQLPFYWTAPEAYNTDGQITGKYDVWSFGVLAYEIVTYGAKPYDGMDNETVKRMITNRKWRMQNPHGRQLKYKKCECPAWVYDMMTQCWHVDPEMRPTFMTIKHQLTDISGTVVNTGEYMDIQWLNTS